MDTDSALALVDALVFDSTGEHLNDLKAAIFQRVWQGQKYLEIAADCGYTEGHVKDIGSTLWRQLSDALGEKVTKRNCRSVLKRYKAAVKQRLGQAKRATSQAIVPANFSVTQAQNRHLNRNVNRYVNRSFVGRKTAIADLHQLIRQNAKLIVIQGEGGLGKTTLAQQFLQAQSANSPLDQVLEVLMAKETETITSAHRVVEEWLRQDFDEEPGQEFGVTLSRLKRQLKQRRVGILIDNLEPALDANGRFLPQHRGYAELLRILADPQVQAVTLITSRDRICEAGVDLYHYRLPGLSLSAWQDYFQCAELDILTAMHQAYGGNAKAMGVLYGLIQEDFAGDLVAYWQEYQGHPLALTTLQNLVESQITRLQSLDPAAYQLLCRLGCYRYQATPTVPTAGLKALMWDVNPGQQQQVIQSLRNRCLIEHQTGEYWLHPAIRAAAVNRLRHSSDYETAHRQAANVWSQSVPRIQSVQDALQALEAYYHHVAIQDFEAAAAVLLRSRLNQWQQFLPLGSTLYRMGFLHPVVDAIEQVLPHLQPTPNQAELCNILGDLYWITGRITDAIQQQQHAIATAQTCLQEAANDHQIYYLRMIAVDSQLSIGLYCVDRWDLATAQHYFQTVIDQATDTPHHPWAEKATVCLALVHTYQQQFEQAKPLADAIYSSIASSPVTPHSGRFAYFIQMLAQVYSYLQEFERAQELYDGAIASATEGHYLQVRGQALNGLAVLHRLQGNCDRALVHHAEAIDILEMIDAKCDLANALFQQGLTYQMQDSHTQAQQNFDQAIELFQAINAPNQVQRIRHQCHYLQTSLHTRENWLSFPTL